MSMRVGLAAVPLNLTTPVTEAPPGEGMGPGRPAAQSMVRETRSRAKTVTECLFMYPPAKCESRTARRVRSALLRGFRPTEIGRKSLDFKFGFRTMEKTTVILAQCLNVMHNIPDLLRLQSIRKRGHRRAIQTGGQVLEQIAGGLATFEVGTLAKVERQNRISFAVSQRKSGRAISPSLLSVTAPAIQALKQVCASLDAIGRRRWLRRYGNRRNRRFLMKPG